MFNEVCPILGLVMFIEGFPSPRGVFTWFASATGLLFSEGFPSTRRLVTRFASAAGSLVLTRVVLRLGRICRHRLCGHADFCCLRELNRSCSRSLQPPRGRRGPSLTHLQGRRASLPRCRSARPRSAAARGERCEPETRPCEARISLVAVANCLATTVLR